MGPAMVLTVGVLALLNNFTQFHFHQTWPIFLIVLGLVKVLGSSPIRMDTSRRRCRISRERFHHRKHHNLPRG